MKLSARNQILGKVTAINHGAVNTEISIEVAPQVELTSVITKASAEQLELKVGSKVYAVIKASNIMVAVD